MPVTGRGGPKGCETLRLARFLDNRLTDGGEVSTHTRRPRFLVLIKDGVSVLLRKLFQILKCFSPFLYHTI
jgi:hypothetical protein